MNKALSPLKRNVDLKTRRQRSHLLSDLSAAVTGEIHFVDGGYSIIGAPPASELRAGSPRQRRAGLAAGPPLRLFCVGLNLLIKAASCGGGCADRDTVRLRSCTP
jgi:hypothetical protein